MAKLGTYYSLCPLIDHRSLLGICENGEPGNVIVTLGKNIAIKYKLHDQKQILSWRTKDKFSSPVVYDKDSDKYVAVFNTSYIRMWTSDVEDIDKLKKIKFKKPVDTLASFSGKTFVVFKNGTVMLLQEALNTRKELATHDIIDEKSDVIIEILCTTVVSDLYIGLITNTNNEINFIWYVHKENEKPAIQKLRLKRGDLDLQGYVFHSNIKDEVQLFTLWSDGKMYTYNLSNFTSSGNTNMELFCIIESVSCKHPVTMTVLNKDYIAMYGANSSEEGAAVLIYNIQFRITQSKQIFKLFTNGAKLWQIENNLLLCVGQNLAVIPFKLDVEQLAALVGSHKVIQTDQNCDVSIVQNLEVATWKTDNVSVSSNLIPKKIKKTVSELANQGLAENQICEEILPNFIDSKDVESVSSCLEYFCDFPEMCLAKLLKFCLTADSKLFKSNKPVSSESFPASLQPLERCTLMDKTLMKSFSDVLLLPYLRCELNIGEIVLLLQYISYLLSEDGHCLPSLNLVESERKLIDWCCVLLDSSYQKFLLSKDECIKETLIHLSKLINSHITYLDDLSMVAPLLLQLKKGKVCNKSINVNMKYSIEELSIY